MVIRTARWALLLGGLLLLTPLLPAAPWEAAAQDAPRPRAGEIPREELVRRIVLQFERRLTKELGLTQDQLRGVQEVMAEFRPRRHALMRERNQLRARLREGRRSGMDAEAAESLLARGRELREREFQLEREEEARFLDVLIPEQLVGLQLLREELSERIRRLDRRPRSRPPGRDRSSDRMDAPSPHRAAGAG
jgi:Spy/CpxP family protein refolding chaperone